MSGIELPSASAGPGDPWTTVTWTMPGDCDAGHRATTPPPTAPPISPATIATTAGAGALLRLLLGFAGQRPEARCLPATAIVAAMPLPGPDLTGHSSASSPESASTDPGSAVGVSETHSFHPTGGQSTSG